MLPEIHAAPMYHYFAKKLTSEEVVAPFEAPSETKAGGPLKGSYIKFFVPGLPEETLNPRMPLLDNGDSPTGKVHIFLFDETGRENKGPWFCCIGFYH